MISGMHLEKKKREEGRRKYEDFFSYNDTIQPTNFPKPHTHTHTTTRIESNQIKLNIRLSLQQIQSIQFNSK